MVIVVIDVLLMEIVGLVVVFVTVRVMICDGDSGDSGYGGREDDYVGAGKSITAVMMLVVIVTIMVMVDYYDDGEVCG